MIYWLTDIHNYVQILQFYIHLPNLSALIQKLNDKDKLLEIIMKDLPSASVLPGMSL